jgi:hypothetical protein
MWGIFGQLSVMQAIDDKKVRSAVAAMKEIVFVTRAPTRRPGPFCPMRLEACGDALLHLGLPKRASRPA